MAGRRPQLLLASCAAFAAAFGVGGRAARGVPDEVAVEPVSVEDPSGRALDAFFAALRRTARGDEGAVTRIAHYGDSIIVGDAITRTARRLFQERYGNAGPGFVLAGRPWPWYRRDGVQLAASSGWITHRVTNNPVADRLYGLGGATFSVRQGQRVASFATTSDLGRPVTVSGIDIHYLLQPGGGDLEVLVDDHPVVTLSTSGETAASAFHRIEIPDGQHRVVLRSSGGGAVRLFGVALERRGPGVVYDSLGINGATATILERFDQRHWAEQLAHRRPHLVVLMFGANESTRPGLDTTQYASRLAVLLRTIEQAVPEASCLVMSPLDRGERRPDDSVRTNPMIPRIVEAQRRAAFDAGCAFFDTYAAMGGEGSMWRWARRGLAASDLTHPSPRGASMVGEALFRSLETSFAGPAQPASNTLARSR